MFLGTIFPAMALRQNDRTYLKKKNESSCQVCMHLKQNIVVEFSILQEDLPLNHLLNTTFKTFDSQTTTFEYPNVRTRCPIFLFFFKAWISLHVRCHWTDKKPTFEFN